MKAQCFVTLTLILICLFGYSDIDATTYPEGTWDFTALATKMTLDAKYLIIGEVVNVSHVFHYLDFEPLSAVTVQVMWDINEEIDRVKDQGAGDGQDPSKEDNETPKPRTVSFVQTGGPLPDESFVQAVGVRVLRVGEIVFLRLRPTTEPIINNGQTYHSCTEDFGTVYSVTKDDDDIKQSHISQGWQSLDINVLNMSRIIRVTQNEPDQMRALEREISELKDLPKGELIQKLINKVDNIETALDLSSFK